MVTNFFEFIGFMVFKTTVSISRLTSFLQFGKRCFLARDISNSLSFFMVFHFTFYRISLARRHRFPNHEKLVNREIETVVSHTINPMNSKKLVTTYLMDFWFFTHRFFRKNLRNFFLKWGAYPGGIPSNQFTSFNLKDSLLSDNSRFSDCCL